MFRNSVRLFALSGIVCLGISPRLDPLTVCAQNAAVLTEKEIIEEFKKASTGNIADAVDEATGHRGFMSHDMKPIFKTKIMGPAATAMLRPVLKNDSGNTPTMLCRSWTKRHLEAFWSMCLRMVWRLRESGT